MTRTLHVCVHRRLGAGSCAGGGGEELLAALQREIARRGLDWTVAGAPCLAHCGAGPNVKAAPSGPLLHHCRADDASGIIDGLAARWMLE